MNNHPLNTLMQHSVSDTKCCIPASYLVLVQHKKILLSRRYNTGYEDGKYSLVAGHVEFQETFRQAIIREASEEAGIILSFEDLHIVHVMQRFELRNSSSCRARIDIFIQANHWSGDLVNKEPHKCDELKWFPLGQLPKNTIPYVQYAVNNIQKNIFYSEFDTTFGV